MEIASLVVACVTLFLAFLIHSEARETWKHVDATISTLPGFHDIKRAIMDIEKTGEFRATVICDEPKSTHINWEMPPPGAVCLIKRKSNKIWEVFHKLANPIIGNFEVPVGWTQRVKWEINSMSIGSAEVEKLLTEGWEPFSVTSDGKIWIRKEVKETKVDC